jgi:hypothetical protein
VPFSGPENGLKTGLIRAGINRLFIKELVGKIIQVELVYKNIQVFIAPISSKKSKVQTYLYSQNTCIKNYTSYFSGAL